MLPQIAPDIAAALAEAKMITFSNGGEGAAETTTNNITSVIQTVLAAQLVSKGLMDGSDNKSAPSAAEAKLPSALTSPATTAKK
jgi:flotillin